MCDFFKLEIISLACAVFLTTLFVVAFISNLLLNKNPQCAEVFRGLAVPNRVKNILSAYWPRAIISFTLLGAIVMWAVFINYSNNPQSSGIVATLFPPVQKMQISLGVIEKTTTAMAEGIDKIAKEVKKENSKDPRKELANLGISWSVDDFGEASKIGDIRVLRLFLEGGMPPNVVSYCNDSSYGGMYFVVTHAAVMNVPNLLEVLDLFLYHKIDLNAKYPKPRMNFWGSGPQIGADIAYISLINGRLDVVKFLKNKGVNLSGLLSYIKTSEIPYNFSKDEYPTSREYLGAEFNSRLDSIEASRQRMIVDLEKIITD